MFATAGSHGAAEEMASNTISVEQSQPEQEDEAVAAAEEEKEEEGRDISMEQWLDGLGSGFGAQYGHIFEELGCSNLSELHMIGNERLAVLQSAIKASSMDKRTRRLIRAALRIHLDEMRAAVSAAAI